MKNPWILPAATLVVGAIGGYITGNNTSPADTQSAAENTTVRTRSTSRPDSAADVNGKRSKRISGVEEVSRLPGNSSRIQALIEFYSGLSPEQLEEEARKLENLPMNERIMASFLLFGRWAEVDPTAAMAFSNTMGFGGAFVRPTILQSWASVDPANAAKYYLENPREFAMMGMMGGGRGPMGGQGPASIIASEWARQDPAAAMAWASSLTTDKSQAMSAVVGEVAKTDPAKAAEMVASMEGDDKGRAYRTVAEQYGASNFSEAQAWIRTLPADEQDGALAAAISGLAKNDPQAAAKQVALMPDGDSKNHAIADVVGPLARVDPAAAAEFLKQHGSEEAQQDSMRELMPSWVAQDSAAALNYASSLPAGDVRDSALRSYVWSNNTAAPADLVQVAEGIADERDRSRTVGMTVGRWMREDPAAAKAYVEQIHRAFGRVQAAPSRGRLHVGRGAGVAVAGIDWRPNRIESRGSRTAAFLFSGGALLVEHEKRAAGPVIIHQALVRVIHMGAQEVRKLGEPTIRHPWLAPMHQVGEIHVRSEVLAAAVLIDRRPLETLLQKIGADGAVRPALIERFRRRAIIDGEHAAGFPRRHPAGEPLR